MPHVIVKLWPGETEQHKRQLADRITKAVEDVIGYGEESVSVSMIEVKQKDWIAKVYDADIASDWDRVYKKPGYRPEDI